MRDPGTERPDVGIDARNKPRLIDYGVVAFHRCIERETVCFHKP